MKTFIIEEIEKKALHLFDDVKNALNCSGEDEIRNKVSLVPTQFFDPTRKINVVFAGQYSAGKSTILSILTQKKLKTGGGITTEKPETLEWNGMLITDTPGIHTHNRPDHDEITYEAISKADLIVFVVTSEGFSNHLGNHFRELIIEKSKGNEMMLIVNKMGHTRDGNTKEQQEIILKHDILPVIKPYTAEDYYVSFLDALFYLESQKDKNKKYQDQMILESGINSFIENLNHFVQDKKLVGKCSTSLYEVEKLLSDIISSFNTGDPHIDATIHFLSKQRQIIVETKKNISDSIEIILNKYSNTIENWGNEIANNLLSTDRLEEVNNQLSNRLNDVDELIGEINDVIEKKIDSELSHLKNQIDDFENTEFAQNLKFEFNKIIDSINISDKNTKAFQEASDYANKFGIFLAKNAVGQNSSSGLSSFFKLSGYSGSNIHTNVKTAANFLGYKLKPWEAVKWTRTIGQTGKLLGVAGAGLGVFLQIRDDKNEDKVEREMKQKRGEIRNDFKKMANVTETRFNNEVEEWIKQNLNIRIEDIDKNIEQISEIVSTQKKELDTFNELLKRTRLLIDDIHLSAKENKDFNDNIN